MKNYLLKKSTFRILSTFILVFFIAACNSGPGSQLLPPEVVIKTFPTFLNEGHRGASGLKPENTIPAMIKAIEEGANVIELDVLISKDNQVVVSHDFRLNRSITLSPNGEEIPEGDGEEGCRMSSIMYREFINWPSFPGRRANLISFL